MTLQNRAKSQSLKKISESQAILPAIDQNKNLTNALLKSVQSSKSNQAQPAKSAFSSAYLAENQHAERYALRKTIEHGNNLVVMQNTGSAFKHKSEVNLQQKYIKRPELIMRQKIMEKNLELLNKDEHQRMQQEQLIDNILGLYSNDNNQRIAKKRAKMAQLIKKLKEEQYDKKEQIDLLDHKMRLYYLIREYAKEMQGTVTPDNIDNFTEEILDIGFFDILKQKQNQQVLDLRERYLRRKLLVQHKPGEGDLAEAESETSSMMIEDQEFQEQVRQRMGNSKARQNEASPNSIPIIKDLYRKTKDSESIPQNDIAHKNQRSQSTSQNSNYDKKRPPKCKFCLDKDKGVRNLKGKCTCDKKQREFDRAQLQEAMRKKVFGLEDLKRMNTRTLEYLDQVEQNPRQKVKSQPKPQISQSTSKITQQNAGKSLSQHKETTQNAIAKTQQPTNIEKKQIKLSQSGSLIGSGLINLKRLNQQQASVNDTATFRQSNMEDIQIQNKIQSLKFINKKSSFLLRENEQSDQNQSFSTNFTKAILNDKEQSEKSEDIQINKKTKNSITQTNDSHLHQELMKSVKPVILKPPRPPAFKSLQFQNKSNLPQVISPEKNNHFRYQTHLIETENQINLLTPIGKFSKTNELSSLKNSPITVSNLDARQEQLKSNDQFDALSEMSKDGLNQERGIARRISIQMRRQITRKKIEEKLRIQKLMDEDGPAAAIENKLNQLSPSNYQAQDVSLTQRRLEVDTHEESQKKHHNRVLSKLGRKSSSNMSFNSDLSGLQRDLNKNIKNLPEDKQGYQDNSSSSVSRVEDLSFSPDRDLKIKINNEGPVQEIKLEKNIILNKIDNSSEQKLDAQETFKNKKQKSMDSISLISNETVDKTSDSKQKTNKRPKNLKILTSGGGSVEMQYLSPLSPIRVRQKENEHIQQFSQVSQNGQSQREQAQDALSQESSATKEKLEDYKERGYLDLNDEIKAFQKEIKISVLEQENVENQEKSINSLKQKQSPEQNKHHLRLSGFSYDGNSAFKKQMRYWHNKVKPDKIPKPSRRKNLELQLLDVQNEGTKILRIKKFKLSDLVI